MARKPTVSSAVLLCKKIKQSKLLAMMAIIGVESSYQLLVDECASLSGRLL